MKFWSLAVLAAAFLATSANAAPNRPVIEDFTNNGCPPCLTIKDSLDAILDEYKDDVTVLSPHVWWPAEDSFFNMNPIMVGGKVAQYNINGVPDFIFGGENIEIQNAFDSPAYYADLRGKLDSMMALTAPIAIDVTHFRTDSEVYVSGSITVEESLLNQSARVAFFLTQTWQRDPNNPTNRWYHILRRAEPIYDSLTYNVEGVPTTVYEYGMPVNLAPGAVIPFDFVVDYDTTGNPWTLNDNIGNPRSLVTNIVVFRGNNNKVLQSFSQIVPTPVGVPPAGEQLRLVLEQNTPNPFNPTTKIRYSLSHPTQVSLDVYNVSGRLVRNLVNEFQGASSYEVVWDGKDNRDRSAASGVYYYSLNADKKAETRKMILIR
ncbi:MAG: T9SS type A sorting domain-containing protein [Gemmatimonadetes bacterium]|nr:T9SS type A sorting domain-containing protein [Gemmatimonadota bacterium]